MNRDNALPQGSCQTVFPRDDLKVVHLCSLPNHIDAFKSKHKYRNSSSHKNFRNLKDLPNSHLKYSLCPTFKNIITAEYFIQSVAVESVLESVLNASVSVIKKANKVIKNPKDKVNHCIDKYFTKKINTSVKSSILIEEERNVMEHVEITNEPMSNAKSILIAKHNTVIN